MFEKIHFPAYEFAVDSEHKIPSLLRGPDKKNLPPRDFKFPYQTTDINYSIHGTARGLFDIPMSNLQKKHFMYIQIFTYLTVDSDYFTRRKNFSSYLLLFTYSGNGELEYEGKTYSLGENDVFLIDCKKEHYYHTTGDAWEHSDLHFTGGESDFLYQKYFEGQTPVIHLANRDSYQPVLEQILLDHTSAPPEREWLVSCGIERLLLYLHTQVSVSSTADTTPETIRYLQKYMENNFTKQLTLDNLASFAGISKYHLSREFKKYTSFSPKEYITRLRISQAKILLSSTTLPAYKIGMLVGIPNETNFIRLFKEYAQMTPGEYRNQL